MQSAAEPSHNTGAPSRCAVIPAAGKGTRLGVGVPKILVPVGENEVVWDVLAHNLAPAVDQFQLIVSRDGVDLMQAHLDKHPPPRAVNLAVQASPTGMGDAVFTQSERWQDFDDIIVCWGDQVSVRTQTVQHAVELHNELTPPRCSVPVVERDAPYVQYDFDANGRLVAVREQREGDRCDPRGLSDVGVFILSVKGLCAAWAHYLANRQLGSATGEVNFLPFFVYLARSGWTVQRVPVADPREAIGINTQEQLDAFMRQRSREH